jgi:hypothetical protein
MTDLERAKQIFSDEHLSFVLVKQNRVLATGTRDGIGELLTAVERLGAETNGASLADKVVGKAVAMLAVEAGVRAVYSPLASEAAQRVLFSRQISLQAVRLVPLIRNKRDDGPCPMERLTMPLDEPRDAVAALKNFVGRSHSSTPQSES